MAQRRDLQRESRQDRGAVLQEGHEGLPRGPVADPQVAGPERPRQIHDRGRAAALPRRTEAARLRAAAAGTATASPTRAARAKASVALPPAAASAGRRSPPAAAAPARSTTTSRSKGRDDIGSHGRTLTLPQQPVERWASCRTPYGERATPFPRTTGIARETVAAKSGPIAALAERGERGPKGRRKGCASVDGLSKS